MILSGARFRPFLKNNLLSLVGSWYPREELFFLHSDRADDSVPNARWSFLGVGEEVEFPKEVPQVFVDLEFSHVPFVGGCMLALPYDGEPYSFFANRVLAFDSERNECFLFALGNSKKESDQKIRNFERRIVEVLKNKREEDLQISSDLRSNMTKDEYVKSIGKIKNALCAGETYQVNFAQKFSMDFSGDPFLVFERLQKINPSPFQCFVQTKNFTLVSNSPERLIRARKKGSETILQSCPIKGTVPRGENLAEDTKNINELLKSEKDNAELTMIVDLVRNDLGIVSKVGSVSVAEHRRIEKYSHVIHTVSEIESVLCSDKTLFDALFALFPGGSITGCPKKRTMEIIKNLEPCKRGFYTGSVGYISVNGNMDFNILIRSIVFGKGELTFHAGGGIVIDSNPEREYEETLHKAGALAQSLVSRRALQNY